MIIQQLTNNDYDDVVFLSSIRNGNIIWEDNDGHDTEIYFYDGNKIVQLSDNNFDDKITGVPINSDINDLIWTAEVYDDHGTYSGIYLYDGEKTIQITDNIYEYLTQVYVTDNRIIWIADTYTDSEKESNIYKYDQETITKITDNISNPQIDQLQIFHDDIFWVAKDSNDNSQLYNYNDELVNQITNNSAIAPQTSFISEVKINQSNGNIIWVSGKQFISGVPGNPNFYSDVEIYLYDGEKTIQITDDSFSGYFYDNLQFLGSNIIWIASSNAWYPSHKILLYNGEEVMEITPDDFNESIEELYIIDNNIFWISETKVYQYNGNEVITLINDNFDDISASIVGDNIVFTGYSSDRTDIYLYENNEITPLVSHDSSMITYTDENNNSIAWYDVDTIQFYNGIQVVEITDNYFNDIQYLEIFDNYVVWGGKKNDDYEVYLYDGIGIIQLTNDNIDNFPRLVDDKYIVWNGNDGNDDEIYLYDINQNKNEDITYLEIDLLNNPIYRFQNTDVLGTYIFVGEEERHNIKTNFPNFIEEGFAFNVANSPGEGLIPLYRFQNTSVPGTYLFAGEAESANIRSHFPNFVEEGVAFYVYAPETRQGITYNRFQNLNLPGTYLFAGPEETANIIQNFPNFVNEGVAFGAG